MSSHHQPELLAGQTKSTYDLACLVRLADQLATGASDGASLGTTQETALVPILAQVELLRPAQKGQWRYQPQVLALNRANIFPTETNSSEAGNYQSLWTNHFQAE